jgi:hypothetical protein
LVALADGEANAAARGREFDTSNAAMTSSLVGRAPPFFACAFSQAVFNPNIDCAMW